MRIQGNPSIINQLITARQPLTTRKVDPTIASQADAVQSSTTDKRKIPVRPLDRKSPNTILSRPTKPPIIITEKPAVQPQPKPRIPGPGETAKAPSLTTASAPSPGKPLTLAGMIEAWGQKDSPYDLTGNGIVDIDDYLQFVVGNSFPSQTQAISTSSGAELSVSTSAAPDSVLSAAAPSQPTTPQLSAGPIDEASVTLSTSTTGPIDTTHPHEPLNLAGLIHAWGQKGSSEYDLNSDGIVNIDDYLEFVLHPPTQAVEKPNLLQTPVRLSAAADQPDSVLSTIDKSLLPVGDSQTLTPSLVDALADSDDSSTKPSLTAAKIEGKSNLNSVRGLQQLTNSLISRLDAAGFEDQPPANIQDVVSKLDLSPRQQQHVFTQLAAKYPQGLGVNLIG